MSFVEPNNLPEDRFLGVIITESDPSLEEMVKKLPIAYSSMQLDELTGLMRTHVQQINPGGEVDLYEIPADLWLQIPYDYKHMLVKRDSLYDLFSMLDWLTQKEIDDHRIYSLDAPSI